MLILTRTPEQTLIIGDDVRIKVLRITGKQVQLGIDAPRSVPVVREELLTPNRSGRHATDDANGT
jgi:carbon storage regulator